MAELAELLAPGQRIFVAGSSNEPTALLEAMAQMQLPEDLHFLQFPIAGLNGVDFTTWNDSADLTTFFMTPTLAKADVQRIHYLPMQMRAVFDYLAKDVDVCLLQVAHDRNGVLRVGPNVDFVAAVLSGARIVIAELNRHIVAPLGCPRIESAQIDYLFESDRSLATMATPKIDEAAQSIGKLVAGLINDGDCVQTGIGAIPAAILNELSAKNDLGLHGGLIDAGGMRLIEAGNVNGARKAIDRGLHITGMALGDSELFDWLADQPSVVFRGADHTHEVSAIAELDNFVSINSAVEVDLFGQVNAEFAGGKQISGTGGSVDFMRAAKASKGGRSIVAMNATARGGTVSRIVPQVDMVTALRTDVDIVVTEFGVAQLKNLPNRQRQDALIEIAAPQFRDELREGSLKS
ncbi:MAG: acetyl-CoA hydrolase/transferase C-terminal domain-containing protein [Pseudomonadota bacterium]|nr:acetyl-CoA hydrolase/transferase C-terminal domain-containing protein [Pseudomonadota bacterium]MEC7970535.1 acetyl-CoA hydrolase/transferase C-terminal domain-containing protein [Pseudomonadota bacterium]MEC7975493.1 acetyl-CoA hydrolase/transferase C-terminal domain-containing protein [Pseudomonadota bacterium]MEC9132835.1 acetyl-CoA hydrolase/transferase C-terminal domain-containing protein [Pseudomonadota bacterium]